MLGQQTISQAALELAARAVADCETQPLQRPRRRNDDPATPAFFQNQLGQLAEPVILDRLRQQPFCQVGAMPSVERTKPEPILQFRSVATASLLGCSSVVDSIG